MRFLPEASTNKGPLITLVFAFTGILAIVITFLFGITIQWTIPSLSEVLDTPIAVMAYMLLVVSVGYYGLVNAVFTGLRSAKFVFTQSIILGVLRIGFVAAFITVLGVIAILVSWALATWITIIISIMFIWPRMNQDYTSKRTRHIKPIIRVFKYSFSNFVAVSLWNLPLQLMPAILLHEISPEISAYFFIALVLADGIWSIPMAISQSLSVEGAFDTTSVIQHVKRSLRMIALTVLAANILVWFFGDKLLLLFGDEYSEQGVNILRILALATIPISINQVYIGVMRVRKTMVGPIIFVGVGTISILSATYILMPRLEILAPAIAILMGHTIVAILIGGVTIINFNRYKNTSSSPAR
jgi:O-antigen/teichoic acid export membrane protein